MTIPCPRIKQQQEAIDRAVERERRRPLSDRIALAQPSTAADWLLRDHAERAAAQQQLGETVEQWMARTGQKPEALPPDAGAFPDHSHRRQNTASWNNRPVKAK